MKLLIEKKKSWAQESIIFLLALKFFQKITNFVVRGRSVSKVGKS